MRILILLMVLASLPAVSVEIPKPINLSAKVVDIGSQKVVYEHTPEKLLYPASNQKIATLYAALNLLPSGFAFSTQLFTDGDNAYIKFTGDPTLTYERLSSLVGQLKEHKIQNMVIDVTDFDDEHVGPGWMHDQSRFCYQSPISAAIIDNNCELFNLSLTAGNHLLIEPVSHTFLRLHNAARMVSDENRYCEFELASLGQNTFKLSGCYTKQNLPPMLKIAANSVNGFVKNAVADILNKQNIKYKSIRFGRVGKNAHLVAQDRSQPLEELLKEMMVNSNNQIAEALFKKIAQEKSGHPGNWKNGAKIVGEFINGAIPDAQGNFQVSDGSGISRKNLLSANIITNILVDNHANKNFVNSFPQAGVSGTVQYRFKEAPHIRVLAKTGGADNTSSLSGYAFSNGRRYAFSLIINGYLGDPASIKLLEENILIDAIRIDL